MKIGSANSTLSIFLIVLLLYLSGFVLSSRLMVVSPGDIWGVQVAKMSVSALHALVMVAPVYLIGRRSLTLQILGLSLLAAYFLYLMFLCGYFGYFGFVPEVYTFGFGNIGDMSRVLDHYFAQVLSWREPTLLVLGVATAVLAIRIKPGATILLTILVPVVLFSATFYRYGSSASLAYTGNDSFIRRFGVVPFVASSAQEWFAMDGNYIGAPMAFPGNVVDQLGSDRQRSNTENLNPSSFDRVSLIQIESLDLEAITSSLNGISVMPFVSELRKDCIDFANFFTLRSAGGSADAEFTVATGMLPSTKAPAIRYADFSAIDTLYHVLERNGIDTLFLHNNVSGFYGRNHAYGQLLPVLDAEFLEPGDNRTEAEIATDALSGVFETGDRSFYYFFNFQSHGPFKWYSEDTAARFGVTKGASKETDYLATMAEVDDMIRQVFEVQRDEYDAGRAVFLLTADHQSGLFGSPAVVDNLRIPMMICGANIQARKSNRVSTSVDIYPTVLSLFGINEDVQTMGTDLQLGKDEGIAILPSRQIIELSEDGSISIANCNEDCDPFLNYTDQFILQSQ
ncbi:LTA synthase family protein [Cognatiyoonia koreensis]|nr:sulfatase-like hydrolase/transferase [Cognatiyoonia koreensis]